MEDVKGCVINLEVKLQVQDAKMKKPGRRITKKQKRTAIFLQRAMTLEQLAPNKWHWIRWHRTCTTLQRSKCWWHNT